MVEYSSDELTWPDWLDATFFTKVLQTYKHDQTIEVKSYEITPGTAKGEHFASIMFRAAVTFSSKKYKIDNEEIAMIMKLLPSGDGFKATLLKESPMFKNEIRMYTSILPEMERILEQAGEKITLAPPLIYQNLHDHPSPVLILKDVRPDGFTVPPWGVDSYDTVKIIARTIARFHAASLLMIEQGANFDFGEHFFLSKVNGVPQTELFMKPGFLALLNDLRKNPELQELCDKVIENADQYFTKVLESYTPSTKTGYKVLNHGDFHAKNILIRNGARVQEDLLLIDYQFPVFTTPAVDVYYLINLMTNPEIRAKHRDEIYRFYFTEFTNTLKKIGYRGKVPTMVDFRIEMLQWSAIDLLQSTNMVSMQFIDPADFDMDKFAEDPASAIAEAMKAIVECEPFKKHVKDSITRLKLQGTLG